MKTHSINDMEVQFKQFRVSESFAINRSSILAPSPELNGKFFDGTITFGCIEDQMNEPFNLIVKLKFQTKFSKDKNDSTNILVEGFVEGEGLFAIKNISKNLFDELFNNDVDFLNKLVEQVFLLASSKLTLLFNQMGIPITLPLSMPPANRLKKSDNADITKAVIG